MKFMVTSSKFYFAAFALNQKASNIKRKSESKSYVNNLKICFARIWLARIFYPTLGSWDFSHSQLLLRIVVNIKWKFSSKYANMLSKVQQGFSSPTLFSFHFAAPQWHFNRQIIISSHNIFIMKILMILWWMNHAWVFWEFPNLPLNCLKN